MIGALSRFSLVTSRSTDLFKALSSMIHVGNPRLLRVPDWSVICAVPAEPDATPLLPHAKGVRASALAIIEHNIDLAGAVGGAVVGIPAYWGATREMDVKMVEIAVGILSQEPKENIAPAREWAVEVISFYSDPEVKPSEQVKDGLTRYKAVRFYGDAAEFSSEFSDEFAKGQRPAAPTN